MHSSRKEWEILETEEFEREFEKLPIELQRRFENQLVQVKNDPFGMGKPLGCNWFRELKNNKYRLYYLVYEKEIITLLVNFSDKNNQQKVIDKIKKSFTWFKTFIRNNYKD